MELFKPSTDLASLLVQMEKKLVLGVGFSLGNIIMGTCFRPCGRVYLAVGTNPMDHFLAQIFLESRLSS